MHRDLSTCLDRGQVIPCVEERVVEFVVVGSRTTVVVRRVLGGARLLVAGVGLRRTAAPVPLGLSGRKYRRLGRLHFDEGREGGHRPDN